METEIAPAGLLLTAGTEETTIVLEPYEGGAAAELVTGAAGEVATDVLPP